MQEHPPSTSQLSSIKKEVAKLLINQGADVNARDKDGWTPLHYAAYDNSKGVAELLIKQGADVDVRDEDSYTSLDIAREKGHDRIITLLKRE